MSNEHERFRNMVESSQDWFWEFDEHANFTYVSPRIKDLLGYEPEEIIGLNAFDLMDAEEAERVHKHFDPIAKKYLPFNNLENINLHKDGHEVVIESCGTPIFDGEGKFCGYRGIDRDITLRKKTEEALRERNRQFRNILETSSEWIWEMDLSGRHTYSNHRLFELLGYRPEEFLGKGYSGFLHEEDLLEVRETLPQLISEKKGWYGWVLRWRHRDGSFRFLESNAKPIFNSAGDVVGYSGADRDVTERQLAEDALRKSQELLAQTQQIAQVGSWQLDIPTNRLTWSDETYRIFGLNPQDFAATYEAFLETIHPEDRASVEAAYSASLAAAENAYEIEHRIIKKNSGEVRYVHEKCKHERNDNGVAIRSVGMVQDITERRTNELALLAATQATEAANRAKNLFLAKVSHEIRTPMTAIVGFGELLEDTELTPEQKKYLAAINTSSIALSSLIDDVMDLSKVDSGQLTVNPKNFSLRNFMTHLADTQAPKIARKNLSFDVNIDTNLPDEVIGDPLRIQQVLLNLLGNAIKFTERGHISIAVTIAEETNLAVLLDIAVKDTGVGIPVSSQERIFEPFVQAHNLSNHNYGGTGLGLAISRSLAALMGGTIRVESQEGVGSAFHLLVPLQKKDDNLSQKPLPGSGPLVWNGPILKILLAEDNPVNSEFFKIQLENMGHVVIVVENGKAALDTLKANTFDLALMDIQMPVMNGDDVLSVIRELEELSGKHLPVIAMTAYALIGDKEKYLKMGFDGYLSKPFKTKDLMEELIRVVPG